MRSLTVALGLGSNLQSPIQNLRLALAEIKKIPQLTVLKVSSLYDSDALLPKDTPANSDWNKKYLNAVVLCEIQNNSTFSPRDLLHNIKQIEKKLCRAVAEKWAPRLIDIDILYSSEPAYHDADLHIPHLHLLERPFALLPLLEVWKDLNIDLPSWSQSWIAEKPFNTIKNKTAIWPQMLGVLNITSDSFSDGGQFKTPEKIYAQALHLLKSGADILDVGAESTRPGAIAISDQQEVHDLLLALQAIEPLRTDYPFRLSLDSRKPSVVFKILQKYQIDFINDVTGFESREMRSLLSESKASAFVMHSLTIPPSAEHTLNTEQNPCKQLINWWHNKSEQFAKMGIDQDRIIFDPGIGFGKTKLQSMFILNHLEEFSDIKNSILIGHSRKSFQTYFSDRKAADRDLETALITKDLNLAYVQYLRVHDIETQKIALRSTL